MSEGLIEMAIHGQPVVATPFTLAGAMSPATLAGAIAQQNAEALFMVALAQLARPGAPMVYGGFTSNVDMRTGSPAFGTPEFVKAAFATGQMARRYGLPWRSSNATASNVVDAQAAYESQMAIWGAIMGGVSLLYQGAGWLEGGLTASFEKLILDAEMLQMMAEVLVPFTRRRGGDRARRDGRGRARAATTSRRAHTLERYETAFYRPILSDWRNFETWSRGRRADRDRAGEPDLEAAPRRVRAAAARPGRGGGDRRVRRAAPARDRGGELGRPWTSIDLRSDTVTRPSAGMRAAMAAAEVGDDQFGEDPTTNRLQERVAGLLGKEAALWLPTGTMANQVALRVLTRPGDDVIVSRESHAVWHETGAGSGERGRPVHRDRRRPAASPPTSSARRSSRETHMLFPPTTLVEVENTHNRAGGVVVPPDRTAAICAVAAEAGIATYLDGARLWNAAVASAGPSRSWRRRSTSSSVALSKGLGAPGGSLLAGSAS